MPVGAGTRLGPYFVEAPLGAGGMGEVYRARDTRLNRDVAIKVLPATLARDPDRVARFEREAQAVAALSHPNIDLLRMHMRTRSDTLSVEQSRALMRDVEDARQALERLKETDERLRVLRALASPTPAVRPS